MKSMILVALALVAVAMAAPAEQAELIPILRSDFVNDPAGGYNFGYETGNGIVREEKGELKEVLDEENKPHSVVVIRGSYSYTNPDGSTETITYIADENGFRPEGPSIPKAVRR